MINKPFIRGRFLAISSSVLVLFSTAFSLSGATFFYTFGGEGGGAASITLGMDGAVSGHEVLPGNPLASPKKIAVSADGEAAIVTTEEAKRVWIFALSPSAQPPKILELDEATTEVQALGDHALVSADKGYFYWIDLKSGRIDKKWNSRESLKPSGNKGEDILFLPGKDLALVSFQKDSKEGKHKGSRLVLLDLRTLTAKADLPLPRDNPKLNIAADKKEQGPNPELIFLTPKSNTIALSLDLYGAMAFADLDAALRGQWKNLDYIPTAPDGSWGHSFPDRGALFELGGKDYLLIANAAENGGMVLFDVKARKIIQTFEVEAGAETPVYLPKEKKLVTVISGKMKQRTAEGLEKSTTPGNDLLVIDVAPLETGGQAVLERIPFEQSVVRVNALDPETTSLLLLVEGETDLVIYDLANKKEITREPAKGVVNRLAVWRGK